MQELDLLRKQLVELLSGRGAHIEFDEAVKDFPEKLRGVKPEGGPHTAWQLLEHLRIAQWDILEFSRDPKHVSPKWPEGYWPKTDAPPTDDAWEKSIQQYRSDLEAMQHLVSDKGTDLFLKLPQGDGQTVLKEALVLADHNSYHLGQLMYVRKTLEAHAKK